ncbi:MAG TPA: hypothetical protein VEL76_15085 [Gemmataceae bacterium]|nr:hypothetical protein [Gemmataceae bacterium]
MSYYPEEFLHERFLASILSELRLRHVAFDRREFDEYMATMKPLVMPEGDSPVWWADAFVEAMKGEGHEVG